MRPELRVQSGADIRYRRISRTRTGTYLRFFVHEDIETTDAMSLGCWLIVTSDNNMSETELLVACKRQSNLGRRHHQLKGDPLVASMFWHDLGASKV